MPQVYAIASMRGLEIGFAASIAEDDYFDPTVKESNRKIIPLINEKLPNGSDSFSRWLSEAITLQGRWHFNGKTRLTTIDAGFDEFQSVEGMLKTLKHHGEETGGGAICRLFALDELDEVDLAEEFRLALSNFAPLLARCSPTPWDMDIRSAQSAVERLEGPPEFAPSDDEDGRRKVWAEVARRQGQGAFRRSLIEAYEGQCAISLTDVSDVLQAAHIRPYNGPRTNHVSNGLLLRADLHTLFDLKLITVEPASHRVRVSPRLRKTPYWEFEGRKIKLPIKPSHQPCADALEEHFRVPADTSN